jgi:hypothetical protein
VKDYLGHDPLSRDLFLFVGRNKDRLKLLYWDADGFALPRRPIGQAIIYARGSAVRRTLTTVVPGRSDRGRIRMQHPFAICRLFRIMPSLLRGR